MEILVWAVTIFIVVWGFLETRAIWVTRRQPVRSTAPTNEIWITPEPRSRRHYDA
jgi:hypothetical protein